MFCVSRCEKKVELSFVLCQGGWGGEKRGEREGERVEVWRAREMDAGA